MGAGKTASTIYPGALAIFLSGCTGQQSALDPAGDEARSVYILFLTMAIGGAAIWLAVVGLMIHAARERRQTRREGSQALILWGGAFFPTVVLLLLLGYALWLMPTIRPWSGRDDEAPRIEVTGEQYWWRIRYLDGRGEVLFETANELRLPVGERTTFSLLAADVIHSFWIPSLGGKMDMIPGRTNRLALTPRRAGVYRGPCAEFCGTSHALMTVTARAVERQAFEAWIAARRSRAAAPAPHEGARLFVRHGCPACHAIDGMAEARGTIGPNLTALGERATIGAGALINTRENIARFIRAPAAVKPGATMPAFDMLPEAEIEAISAWLGGLE